MKRDKVVNFLVIDEIDFIRWFLLQFEAVKIIEYALIYSFYWHYASIYKMLKAIKIFFDKLSENPKQSEADKRHAIHLAVSVLFVEMMRIDGHINDAEKIVLKASLDNKFDLSNIEKKELMSLANQELDQSIDYYQFTSVINQHFDKQKKIKMIEELWRVAFADGKLDAHEEHYIRKVNALIHVSHSDFMKAKHRAQS